MARLRKSSSLASRGVFASGRLITSSPICTRTCHCFLSASQVTVVFSAFSMPAPRGGTCTPGHILTQCQVVRCILDSHATDFLSNGSHLAPDRERNGGHASAGGIPEARARHLQATDRNQYFIQYRRYDTG